VAKTNIKLQNCGLVVFYDIQPGDEVGLFS